jgi:putative ABC transport system permease protein
MDIVMQDLRYAWRALRRTPGFTAVVAVVMALAIGVNAMIFSMVYGILLRPWPLPASERIVMLRLSDRVRGERDQRFSFQDYFDLRDRSHSFQALGGTFDLPSQVTIGTEAESMDGVAVTAGLIEAAGVAPALGRTFTRDEERLAASLSVVIISDHVWRERFGADPNVLGRSMRVNSRVRTIVGVMPPRYRFPESANFWVPAGFDPTGDQRIDGTLRVIGRLAPGVTLEQAQAEVATIVRSLMAEHPELHRAYTSQVMHIERAWNDGGRPFFLLMLAAALFVLVIACANVANLMLARAATRRRELALRVALGAPKHRIVQQLLTESLVLSVLSAALGLLLAHYGNQLWVGSLPVELPFYFRISLDAPVVALTAGVTVLAALLFGLAPAAFATDQRLANAIREGSLQAGGSRAAATMRKGLVVAEIVLALVLLIGAGLMLRSFQHLTAEGERLAVRGGVTGSVLMPIAVYPDDEARRQFIARLTPSLRALPGFRGLAFGSRLPLERDSDTRRILTPGMDPRVAPSVEWATLSPGFLAAMGIGMRSGREFSAQDGPGSPRVAMVNQYLAQRLWPGQDAIGKSLRLEGEPDSLPALTVVGVLADVHFDVEDMHDARQIYLPQAQAPVQRLSVVVWSDAPTAATASALRAAVRALDPDMAVSNLRTLREQFAYSLWVKRLFVRLITVFGVIALVIAAVGLYGVMAYSVAQRTQEIGIRMALGAARGTVVRMVVGQAMQMTFVGCALGLLAAWGVTRFMAALLMGVSPTDPPTFAGVALLLAASGMLAAWVPAMRATRVDPMVALRCD